MDSERKIERMQMRNQYHGHISKGLEFLALDFEKHGEFSMNICHNPDLYPPLIKDSTVFATAVVTYCLRFCDEVMAKKLNRRAFSFLSSLMRADGLWSYWTPRSGKSITPDLDDTACISRLLLDFGEHELLPNLNRQKFFNHQNEEGCFFTWFNKACEFNDVDSVVNANVVWYLGQLPETDRAIKNLINVVTTGNEESSYWYYLNPFSLYYAISRAACAGAPKLKSIFKVIYERISYHLGDLSQRFDPLTLGLGLCTLANLGLAHTNLSKNIARKICKVQNPGGSWEAVAFSGGPEPPGPLSVWFGSKALTTAFCLEGLSRVNRHGA